MGLLRTKLCQNCLALQGSGSNGKSAFIAMISEIIGSKLQITTFGQEPNLGEAIF